MRIDIIPVSKIHAAEQIKIRKIVDDLLSSTESYHKVKVEVEQHPNGTPETLIVSMLRANTYTADVVIVKVDSNYNVKSITKEENHG